MRPHVYRLLLLGCVLAGGCAQSPSGGEQPATDEKSKAVAAIKACRGKELQGLEPDRARELLGHMAKLGLERYPDQVDRFGPWYVWNFARKGDPPLYLLFEAGKERK